MVECGEKWGEIMLMGEYHHNIDEKGRLIIPSKFRYELGEKFIVTRGLDGCLFVYPITGKVFQLLFPLIHNTINLFA